MYSDQTADMVVFKHTSFYASRIHWFDQLKKPHEQAADTAAPVEEANMSGTKTAPICILIPQTTAAKPEHHKIHPGKHIFMNSTFTAQQNLNINTNTTGSCRNRWREAGKQKWSIGAIAQAYICAVMESL